jgi:hypothetical protein
VTGDSEEIAYKKGINWMLQHPQEIEEYPKLYGDELLFYYLMIERSETEKERELYKGVFLQRLRQSDGFSFEKPSSTLENCYYALIMGFRKWSRIWETRDDETDSKLLHIVSEDIMKNTDFYINNNPLELVFIDYVSKKFDIKFTDYQRPEFKWWEFLQVEEDGSYNLSITKRLNYYDFLVGYSITHVIFFDSDYGLRHLDRKSYEREYQYIMGNIERFISNTHIDLVAELIWCLKILEATNTPVYERAIAFVINNQNDDGAWNDIYTAKKHTTIVNILALKQD